MCSLTLLPIMLIPLKLGASLYPKLMRLWANPSRTAKRQKNLAKFQKACIL